MWVESAAADDGEGLLRQLAHCLEQLELRSRTALERHYHDGLDWDEVGRELGLRPNGIKTLAQRARRVLRDCLARSM
jgi:DNA-directed RNA polymerase specialized sigma24 family protein